MVSISVALQNQFKCDATHYVVFTDVAKYQDWVNSAMNLWGKLTYYIVIVMFKCAQTQTVI